MSDPKKGVMVRVSKGKCVFHKGYIPNWSEEHFLVENQRSNPGKVFKLFAIGGEELKSLWYPQEVQIMEKNST